MTYVRPPGLHERAYTNGEKTLLLERQLFLLRAALIRTTAEWVYYPDLFRALRVLVIDGDRGRLGEMAGLVDMRHRVPSMFPEDEGPPLPRADRPPHPMKELRHKLELLVFSNYCSRWLAFRGIQRRVDWPCGDVDFWHFLEVEIVGNKSAFGAPITRSVLIAETANTRDVAHASRHYPTFLRAMSSAFGHTAPLYVELAQEVAYEVLLYGGLVADACRRKFSDQVTAGLQHEMGAPGILCRRCGLLQGFGDLRCPSCGASELTPPRSVTSAEQLSSGLHATGVWRSSSYSYTMHVDVEGLRERPGERVIIAEIADGDAGLLVERTPDLRVVFSIWDASGRRSVEWPLAASPPTGFIPLFLLRDGDVISIVSRSSNGDLVWVGSDGGRDVVPLPTENE